MKLGQAFEPWFLTLALIAFTTTGIVPILLPLELIKLEGNALHVGLVMSAMGAGMLTSPVFGFLADRFRLHRWLITGSALTVGASMYAFCFADFLAEWLALSFFIGCSIAGAFTTGNLLIVCRHPAQECDARIGWMQTLVSAGTVVGLAAAGGVSHLPLEVGFRLAAITSLLAALIAAFSASAPTSTSHGADKPQAVEEQAGDATSFFLLLTAWFFANVGIFGFGAFYPLVMNKEFAVDVDDASYVLAAATVVSTLLFLRASNLTRQIGGRRVLLRILSARLGLLGLLAGLALVDPFPYRDWLALILYFAITVAWPLLAVSSLVLVSQLARFKGRGLGLYDGTTAMGHLAGPVICGQMINHFGYDSVVVFSASGVVVGLLLLLKVRAGKDRPTIPPPP